MKSTMNRFLSGPALDQNSPALDKIISALSLAIWIAIAWSQRRWPLLGYSKPFGLTPHWRRLDVHLPQRASVPLGGRSKGTTHVHGEGDKLSPQYLMWWLSIRMLRHISSNTKTPKMYYGWLRKIMKTEGNQGDATLPACHAQDAGCSVPRGQVQKCCFRLQGRWLLADPPRKV